MPDGNDRLTFSRREIDSLDDYASWKSDVVKRLMEANPHIKHPLIEILPEDFYDNNVTFKISEHPGVDLGLRDLSIDMEPGPYMAMLEKLPEVSGRIEGEWIERDQD